MRQQLFDFTQLLPGLPSKIVDNPFEGAPFSEEKIYVPLVIEPDTDLTP